MNTDIFAGDCETSITDIDISLVQSRTSVDSQSDLLSLAYDINKTQIALSNIWNATTSTIEICQVVQLVISANNFVISEDKRVLSIDFDLSVDFGTNSDLGDATIETEDLVSNVTSYVEACKCNDAQSFTCNTDALLPSTERFVCIKSISSDVEVDFLNSVTLTQGATTLNVVEDDEVSFSEITTRTYNASANAVVVSTFVPTNLFTFAVGNSISITGEIFMRFGSGGDRRRLEVVIYDEDDGKVDEQDIPSNFELEVALQQEIIYGDDSPTDSANSAITSTGLAALGSAFVLVGVVIFIVIVLRKKSK